MTTEKKKRDHDGIHLRRGKYYRISYIDAQGCRQRYQIKATTLAQARAIRNAKLAQVERQRVLGYAPPSDDTLEAFSERYLTYQERRITPKAYERTTGIVKKHLLPTLGSRRLADIRKADVERYVTKRSDSVAAASVGKELNVLKHILALAVRWELIPVNHASGVKPPKPPAGRVRYLQPTEVQAVLEECAPWLRPIVLLLLSTGMRRGELLGLRWLDVDHTGGRILLPQTKNGEGRTLYLNALARQVFDEMLPRPKDARPSDPVFPRTEQNGPENVSLSFLRACRRAKIEDFRMHDLRHTCASWMAMQGADVHIIATQLGHKDLRQSARYQHLEPTFLQAAVQRLDGVFKPDLALCGGTATGPIEVINRA